jgi:hypothetical protein
MLKMIKVVDTAAAKYPTYLQMRPAQTAGAAPSIYSSSTVFELVESGYVRLRPFVFFIDFFVDS